MKQTSPLIKRAEEKKCFSCFSSVAAFKKDLIVQRPHSWRPLASVSGMLRAQRGFVAIWSACCNCWAFCLRGSCSSSRTVTLIAESHVWMDKHAQNCHKQAKCAGPRLTWPPEREKEGWRDILRGWKSKSLNAFIWIVISSGNWKEEHTKSEMCEGKLKA